jgi:ribonucleoside-diphosphate reductase alpha chain
MTTQFDQLATDIAQRQYCHEGETSVEDIFKRVANIVSRGDAYLEEKYYDLMVSRRFCPGGRILAGAGSSHGNLLNCYVVDGNPIKPSEPTAYALNTAIKLAKITKVGGGNGLNLDYLPAKNSFDSEYLGRPKIWIDPQHKDREMFERGEFFDLTKGERVRKSYVQARFLTDTERNQFIIGGGTVISPSDNVKSIWLTAIQMVDLILRGEDVLIDFTALRPEGSPVEGGGGESSGPASFAVEIFDNFARWAYLGAGQHAGPVATLRYVFAPTLRVIRQGGVRRGAGMATLSATHPDILDFVRAKRLNREAEEGDISTFNISVLVDEEILSDEELMEEIAAEAHATGEPGLIFVDTVNENNPLKWSDGAIMATNPCGEIPLYPGEPCDLGALNLAAYVKEDGDLDTAQLTLDTLLAVRFLDAVLDVHKAPLLEIEKQIVDKRRIGLGIMGLGDALIKMGIPYDSTEGRNTTREIVSIVRDAAIEASEYLAILLGEPRFNLRGSALENPRRNVALLTVAPTGTTSMLFGVTSGIEPLFSPLMYRKIGSEYRRVLHPLFVELMQNHPGPAWEWEYIEWRIEKNHGSLQGLDDIIPEEISRVFRCAHDILPIDHVKMQATVQTALDKYGKGYPTYAGNSISKTINLPHNSGVKEVLQAYRYAHELGCKGITVYRDGSRSGQVLNTSLEDDGSGPVAEAARDALEDIVAASCSLDGSCDA